MTSYQPADSRDRRLTLVMCLACAGAVTPFGSYPALLPRLFASGAIGTRDATFINAAFFAGYMVVAPIATSWTDRLDARRLVLPALALGALSSFGFAFFADTFWAALVARAANGACVAASFMPGLRALSDRLPTHRSTRFVGFYMSSFALGNSVSYVLCDVLADQLGVRATLYVMSVGPLLAWLVVLPFLRPVDDPPVLHSAGLFSQVLPVLRQRALLTLVLSYGLHCAELFVLRSWCVAFLASVDDSAGFRPPVWLAPAALVAVANVLTAPASVLGNELSLRIGARRYIRATLTLSPLCLGALGSLHGCGPVVCAVAVLGCAVLLGADSAAITSRLVEAAPPEQRGISMALHTAVGFLGAFLGPMLLGLTLDACGGPRAGVAWAWAFAAVGATSLFGSVVVLSAGRVQS